jgi:hypothetical protein
LSTVVVTPVSLVADGTARATITVTVLDRQGRALPGLVVDLSVSGQGHQLTQPAGPTDGLGRASGSLTSTRAEVKTVTATVRSGPGVVLDARPVVTFRAGALDAVMSNVEVVPTSVTADGESTCTVVVTLLDRYGNPVAGQDVQLASSGSANTLAQPTAPSGGDGVALGFLSSTRAEGKTITATVTSGGPPVQLFVQPTVVFLAGPATRLLFATQPAASVTAGTEITPTLYVTVEDAHGNARLDATGQVTMSLGVNPSGGVLGGTTSRGISGGLASFSELKLERAGQGYTLKATSPGLADAESGPFSVVPAMATRLSFLVQPTATNTGAAIQPDVVVGIADEFGNPLGESGRTVTVRLGSNPGFATLGGTLSVQAASGQARFGNLTLDRTGQGYTLVASASGLTAATSTAFDVASGPAVAMAWLREPRDTGVGNVMDPPPVIYFLDGSGNTVLTATNTVMLAWGNNPTGARLLGTTQVAASSGLASFRDLRVDTAGSGYTLVASSQGLPNLTSGPFAIAALAPTKLAFTAQPSAATVGAVVAPAVAVAIQSAEGIVVGTATHAITLQLLNPPACGGALHGTLTRTPVNGVATFDDLWVDRPGTGLTLRATAPGLTQADSGPFAVQDLRVESLTAAEARVAVGQGTTLSWTLTGTPGQVTLTPPGVPVTGTSTTVTPFPAAPGSVDARATYKVVASTANHGEERAEFRWAGALVPTTVAWVYGAAGYPDGGVVVAGVFMGQVTLGGTRTLTAQGQQDAYVARYGATGALVWAKSMGGAEMEWGRAVAVGPDGSVVVVGSYQASAVFGAGETLETTLNARAGSDGFVAKLAGADGRLMWAKRTAGTVNDDLTGVGVLADGAAVVWGTFEGNLVVGNSEPGEVRMDSLGGRDWVLARYQADGTVAWARRSGGTGNESSGSLSAFPNGSVAVVGTFQGSVTLGPGEANQRVLTSGGGTDGVVAVFEAQGRLSWARGVGGSGADKLEGVAAFLDGTVAASGEFTGSVVLGAGELNQTLLTAEASTDVLLARFQADGRLAWGARAGGLNPDQSYAVAAFPDGSTLLTGLYASTMTLGPSGPSQRVLQGVGDYDSFLARYDATGGITWVKRVAGSARDEVKAAVALPHGGVVVAGTLLGAATMGTCDGTEVTVGAPSQVQGFLARLEPVNHRAVQVTPKGFGTARRAGGASDDEVRVVGTLPDGSAVLAGKLAGSAVFGQGESGQVTLNTAGGSDVFVARVDVSGRLLWARRAGGPLDDAAVAGGVLPDGGIVIAGEFRGTAVFGPGEANQTSLASEGAGSNPNVFIARYAHDGTLTWVKRVRGTDVRVTGVATMAGGMSAVAGHFDGSLVTWGTGEANETPLSSVGGYDVWVAMFASDGSLIWVRADGGAGSDQGGGVAIVGARDPVVVGSFDGVATFGMGNPAEATLTATGTRDMFVARYASGGTLTWVRQVSGNRVLPRSVVGLPDGAFVVVGEHDATTVLGAGESGQVSLPTAGSTDVFTAAYDALGRLRWAKASGGSGADRARGVALRPDGRLVVVGGFQGTATVASGTTLTSAGGEDLFVAVWGAAGALEWARRAGGGGLDVGLAVSWMVDGSVLAGGAFSSTATFGQGDANATTLTATGGTDAVWSRWLGY